MLLLRGRNERNAGVVFNAGRHDLGMGFTPLEGRAKAGNALGY